MDELETTTQVRIFLDGEGVGSRGMCNVPSVGDRIYFKEVNTELYRVFIVERRDWIMDGIFPGSDKPWWRPQPHVDLHVRLDENSTT